MNQLNRRRRHPSLLAWRRHLRLNQRDAAVILRISQATYGRFELGVRAPKPRLGKAIAEKTGVPFEKVMGL